MSVQKVLRLVSTTDGHSIDISWMENVHVRLKISRGGFSKSVFLSFSFLGKFCCGDALTFGIVERAGK